MAISKKTKVVLVLIVLILLAGALAAWMGYRYFTVGWSHISNVMPIDLDNDGKDELIIVYEPARGKYAKTWNMKAISLPSAQTLWKASVDGFPVSFSRYDKSVPVVRDKNMFAMALRARVVAFDKSTGRQIWTYKLPPQAEFQLYSMLSSSSNMVFAHYVQLGDTAGPRGRIQAIDAKTGSTKWLKTCPTGCRPPSIMKNRMFILCPSEMQSLLIDTATGKTSKIGLHGQAYETKEGNLFFGPKRILEELSPGDERAKTVLLDGHEIRIPPDANEYESIAINDGRLLWTKKSYIDKSLPRTLKAVPFRPDKKDFSLTFPDGFAHRTIFYEWKSFAPGYSSFHVIHDRYLPMILTKKFDEALDDFILVTVDLEQGKFAWKSKVFRQSSISFLARDILYHEGLYLMAYKYLDKAQYKKSLLLMDAKTGHFTGAVKLTTKDDEGREYRCELDLHPLHWSKKKLYGVCDGDIWVLDLESMKLLGPSSEKLHLETDSEVEKILGPLP